MGSVPFTVYDFFAYLSSGAVLIITGDYVWHLGLLDSRKAGPVAIAALVILAYVIGHIVAQFSALLFEQVIVARYLRRPLDLLLREKARRRYLAFVFPNFHRPLPETTCQRIKEQAERRSCIAVGEGLFLHAYSLVTADERAQARLDTFRNQYGFARNMSFSLAVAAIAIAVAHFGGSREVRVRWCLLAAFGSLSLFYRYLKFFRQFSYELLIRYAELPTP